MAKKKTFINFVLDETGSMSSCLDATISGFNEYVGELRKNGKGVRFTLTKFNSNKVETVYEQVKLKDVPDLDYVSYKPAAMTPLYDAIAQAIRSTERAVKGEKQSVLCVIMTDGHENSSREFTQDALFKLIKQKETDGWTFAYLGANQDAWAVGQAIGFQQGNVMNYDTAETKKAFRTAANASTSYLVHGSKQSKSLFSEPSSTSDAVN